jgi:hypothetical protein
MKTQIFLKYNVGKFYEEYFKMEKAIELPQSSLESSAYEKNLLNRL